MPGEFVDSNVLIYAFSTDPRAEAAQAVLERGCMTSVQGLNEFANVARRKLGMTWTEVREALASVRVLCRTIVPLDIATHSEALRIAERYRYAMFDALIVASALLSGSDTLWSEDMRDGAVIDGRLRIANPFGGGLAGR
jgi:predicted nucleic acid-binding protein